MSTNRVARPSSAKVVPMTSATNVSNVLQQYGYGAIPFIGTENAFYERHLVFDRAIDPKVASARERFEAFSYSVRDILAQRWVLTKNTYERENGQTHLLPVHGVSHRTFAGQQHHQPVARSAFS